MCSEAHYMLLIYGIPRFRRRRIFQGVLVLSHVNGELAEDHLLSGQRLPPEGGTLSPCLNSYSSTATSSDFPKPFVLGMVYLVYAVACPHANPDVDSKGDVHTGQAVAF